MNELPLHPALVHLPMGLSLVMPVLALIVVVCWWRDWLPRRAWWLVVLLQVVVTAGTKLAEETGEDDVEVVAELVGEELVHEHEEAAELFLGACWGLSVLVILVGVLPQQRIALVLGLVSSAGMGVSAGLAMNAGRLGGELVYQHNAAKAHIEALPPGAVPDPAKDGKPR